MCVYLFCYWTKFQGNITGFFRIGSIIPLSPYLDATKALIYQGELGYDGHLFLSLAFDPLLQNPATILALDNPLYRYRRIFYPMLGYLLGLGNPRLIPAALVAINALCISSLVGLMGWGLRQTREPRWHALLVLCIPGVWLTFIFSTADLVSTTLLVLAICCFRYRRPWATGIAIAAGCLTRETLLLGWLSLVICAIGDRNWRQVKILFMSLIPVVSWNVYVLVRLSQQGSSSAGLNFTQPLVDIGGKFAALISGGWQMKNLFEAYLFLLLIGVFCLTFYLLRKKSSRIGQTRSNRRFDNRVLWIYAGFLALLFAFSNELIFTYYVGYGRVFMDIFCLLLLVLGQPRTWLKVLPFFIAIIPCFAMLGFAQ
ncbi:hypothetical protein IQ266_10785 [filamentous cyanobacterium LEGE 11480]|uniref:Uncharacterized protein n=1 Tax=Romeriopsis navalis LEGE 11480 TaxID=2777977 RepID=A0A928Z4G3_9CYAN|nr:hypothetical protein [Romeriopsis navalis LEGE 11480]